MFGFYVSRKELARNDRNMEGCGKPFGKLYVYLRLRVPKMRELWDFLDCGI